MKNGVTVRHDPNSDSYKVCFYTDGELTHVKHFDIFDELGMIKTITEWCYQKWQEEGDTK